MKKQYFSDTLTIRDEEKSELSDIFYDRLKEKQYKRRITRLMADFLISRRDEGDHEAPIPQLEQSEKYFSNFRGRKITDIRVTQANIFSKDSSHRQSWVERTIDNIHIQTKPEVIWKNLFFDIGDEIDPYIMALNEQLLRNLPFASTAYIVILPSPSDPSEVIVNVFMRDNWTISGDISMGTTPSIEAYDRNFLGTGNKLALTYYPSKKPQEEGFEVIYDFNNFLGTFTNVKVQTGIGKTNNAIRVIADKPFILPTDHIWGLTGGFVQGNNNLMTFDTTVLINKEEFGLWYGHAWGFGKRKGTSFYLSGSGNYTNFIKRPIVREMLNPFYYNTETLLACAGVLRQNFYQGNMIFGYGRTEDIPYGFKMELTGGYQWSEFLGKRPYMGTHLAVGGLTRAGYFALGTSAGTFLTPAGKFQQSAFNVSLQYFSLLMRVGSAYMRQFITIKGTWGFNRLKGEKEALQYTPTSGIRGISRSLTATGYNKLIVNGESVLFSPIYLYHFRFAFFAWMDVGWLGYERNIFANQFTAATGLGVRIKNERLIFNNVQFRLGFLWKKANNLHYNPFQISNEERLPIPQFRPGAPSIVSYE